MTDSSLLVIDAGNTSTKFGLFDAAAPATRELPSCRFAGTTANEAEFPAKELRSHVSGIVTGIIAGSNPRAMDQIRASCPSDWSVPKSVRDVAELQIGVDVDSPEKVGIDRLLAAVAANQIREPGQPAILIDSGTATTVDFVDNEGRFRGGAILPGFDLCARALHEHTEQLPLIEISDNAELPAEIGRNTEAAITSGLYWGQVGAVRELMRRMMHSADHDHPLLLLTGGAAGLLFPHLPTIVRLEPHLVLQGLALTELAR